MNSVKISVIMGVYNEEEIWVRESIESILNQTYKNLEFVIILDNPENKKLKSVIEEYSKNDDRIKFYVNEKNLGLIDTLNKAISLSSGEYIARMDSDDIAINTRLEEQMNFIINNPEYELIGTKVQYIDDIGNEILLEDNRVCSYEDIKKYLKYDNPFAHPTIIYKTDTVKELGGYDKALYAEDYELIMKFVVNGKKVCNLDKKLLKYRLRDTGISISKKDYQVTTTQFLQKTYKKHLKDNTLYNLNSKELDRLLLKDDSSWNKKVYELHKKALDLGKNNNKVSKGFYVLLISIISPKYFTWYKNKVAVKILFK